MEMKTKFKYLQNINWQRVLIFFWLTMLPLICCAAYCLKTGNLIGEVYLPASGWNDEISYYKQVESMVMYGRPMGYFGYAENHALIGGFTVWSPVLIFPWYLWGLLFGWNLLSPIFCNIVLMMLALGAFCILAKPDWKQSAWLTVFYMLFIHFTRYALSAQVETVVYSVLIAAVGLAYALRRSFSYKKIIAFYIISTVLVLMRPYFVLLACIPAYYLYKQNRKYLGPGIGVPFIQIILYFLMTHYFCSPYLNGEGLVGGSWIGVFLEEGILSGLKNFIYLFLSSLDTYMGYLGSSLSTGNSYAENAGIMFAVVFVLFCYKLFLAVQHKEKEKILWNGFWVLYFIAMFLAVIFLFGIASGQKHTLCFTVIGLTALAMEGVEMPKMLMMCFLMLYLFAFQAADGGYDWGIPYGNEELRAEVQKGKEALQDQMKVTEELSFDNTLLWVFDDVVEENYVFSRWQMLYAVPGGIGINMCLFDTISPDLTNIQSKYIFVAAGGRTDSYCREAGMKVLAEYGDSVVYQLRDGSVK